VRFFTTTGCFQFLCSFSDKMRAAVSTPPPPQPSHHQCKPAASISLARVMRGRPQGGDAPTLRQKLATWRFHAFPLWFGLMRKNQGSLPR